MSSENKSQNEVEIMEYTTVKASYESLNKRYRRNHRDMEKGIAALNKSLDELENATDITKATVALSKVLETVCGAKRKAEYVCFEERKLLKSCKRRIGHLSQLYLLDSGSFSRNSDEMNLDNAHNQKTEDLMYKFSSGESDTTLKPRSVNAFDERALCLARFQRHLTDYLFTSGQPLSALKFAQEKPELGDLCMMEVFDEAVIIEKALLEGDTGPAFSWLQEANFKLKKNDSYYEFDLRVFEFYLLVKQGKRIEAIQHARKYMNSVKQADDYRATKLGQAMILLAMRTPEELQNKADQNKLTEKWIVKRTHEVLMEFYAYSIYTPFQLAVNAGITAIKTHYCYNPNTQHRDCAVCHPLINQLAVNLPFARHDHSILTCYKTGLPMNDENPPMSLPNGYVYSQKGIAELTRPDGTITCPRSGKTFDASEVQRVYIV
ncbi:E3 ubiquitin-protein transferase MAEA [Schistosoma japonicum]|nr:E3 ubiquitin-protein transferase MAEA [Schistosoma japonicum]